MATHRISLTGPDRPGERLVDYINDRLPAELAKRGIPALSRSKIRRLIVAGAVSENGRPVRGPAAEIGRKNAITVVLDTDRALFEKETGDIAFELAEDRVLFQDESIIVVNKPAGLPVEATVVSSRDHLHAAVKRYLHRAAGSRNEPYAGLLHRLDRETSGVIILTKRREANAALHEQFATHTVKKEYLALASLPPGTGPGTGAEELRPGDGFRVENRLARITAKSAAGKWGAVTTGGDEAITDFVVERAFAVHLAIRAFPLTGRTHQIRVHLAGLGYPLLGDALYGGPDAPRVMLHAESVTFRHPTEGREITVSAPIPEDFLPFLA